MRLLDLALIVDLVGMTDTGPGTTLDLVLQAGARAIRQRRVLAVAQLEQALHVVDGVTHRTGARKGAVEDSLTLVGLAAKHGQARKIMLSETDVGITLVVAKQYVVARIQIFDQIILQQQRFAFGAGVDDFDLAYVVDQRHDAGRQSAGAEIACQAFLQVLRLADVNHLVVTVYHAVHAWLAVDVGEEFLVIELVRPTHGSSSRMR